MFLLLLTLLSLTILPSAIGQTPLSVTVSTNQTQYSPAQNVLISGMVRDNLNNPVLGAGVSIQVNGPSSKLVHVLLVYTNSAGSYSDSFILPADSVAGQYTVYVSASKSGYANGQNQSQFTVQGGSTTTSSSSPTTSSTTPSQRLCLIATAAYSSELSPEVALLRNFRDNQVLDTKAGASFMQAFNAFYYSFSPQVASRVASNDDIRIVTKAVLYPLVGILYLTSIVFAATSFNGELAVTISGIIAAFGLGFVYFGSIAALIARRFILVRSERLLKAIRTSCLLVLASLILLMLAEVASVPGALMVASVTLVLSCMVLGTMFATWITRKSAA